ncbi:MAG: molybdopterin converting factor [Halieaceae bacterium]|nr:molybdopterin converting factor [Halieaceae bacterium]
MGADVSVSLQPEAIDVAAEYAELIGDQPGAAVATFTGYVRGHAEGAAVTALELEHYPEMAQKVLMTLGETAAERFKLTRWRIVHRHGSLAVSDSIVWVGAVAEHRGEAISACEFMMDTLKTDAPFWKREEGVAGDKWVAQRGIDTRRRERWQEEAQ